MKAEVLQAIKEAMKVASDNEDIQIYAALCFLSAIYQMDRISEAVPALSGMAHDFQKDQNWIPEFLELESKRNE